MRKKRTVQSHANIRCNEMSQRYSRGTAYHEAGHVVVAWSLLLRLGDVSVNADDASGGAQIAGVELLPLVEQIAVLYGGIAAEKLFGHSTHELGSTGDHVKVMELLEDHGISDENGDGLALREQGHDCACARLETHRNKVIALAEQLVERGRVSASELPELLGERP
jgi:hypothetical protein